QAMVDFVNLPETIQVVVDGSGAYIDANANGIVDGDELANTANFDPGGNVVMGYDHVTLHFNDVPNGDINLSGFGADDLIEIDAQAFIDNGHNALQILTLTNVITLDGFTTNGSFPTPPTSPTVYNWRFSSSYGNSHLRQTGYTTFGSPMNRWVNQGLYTGSSRLYFYSNNGSSSGSWQLATQLPTGMPLQQMVDYVNLPVALDPVHVVVEQNGAVIDFDGDGVRDNGENWLADFGSGGNADLANNAVVIRFNDIPLNALHLNGFGTDDKIEIAAGDSWLADFGVGTSSVNYQLAHHSGSPLATVTTMIRVNQFTASTLNDFANNSYHNVYAITALTANSSQGAIAYWTDATNALNNQTNLLPDNFGPSPLSHTAVLTNLNANHYPGLVEFVWPVHLVVDDQAGNVATFIDDNANGVRDAGEDTLALLGQTQADVDAFNTAAGTNYGSYAVDLASEQVTIHYNELPTGTWMPDLTGFGGNDRIEIDVDAMRNGQTGKVLATQSSYNATTWVDAAGVAGGTRWNSAISTYSAVFLAGSRLKYGHTASSSYTVTAINEGTIASNAAALANHYNQQVVFVASPVII
ncbi:MAG TPA: hypothetical protein VFF53_05075, partial [Geobacteraceae bacterium]|nr:hypothetical protein [Geobacteraceae bacterium]